MTDTGTDPVWGDDRLGFEHAGDTFTRLVRSITTTKVISIEAGYGRGKTFFRERWAKQLRAEGELVVEIDAHMADHSGDPVLTFMGGLIGLLPEDDPSKRDTAFQKLKQFAGVLTRTVSGIAVRQGAGALVDYIGEQVSEQAAENEGLQAQIDQFSDSVSKRAGDLLAAQIESERVRTQDVPKQLAELRDLLTQGDENKRIVVLVDELDRCHPDYAIAFLEAMKLVFAEDGFVFCLLVNGEYLEGLAQHRFGISQSGERYLDKFIDLRLALPWTETAVSNAVKHLFSELPEGTPYGAGDEFTIDRAARLAAGLAPLSKLSIREMERVKLKVELAILCYADKPLDYALLVWLAFQQAVTTKDPDVNMVPWRTYLTRSDLTPEIADKIETGTWSNNGFGENDKARSFVFEKCSELIGLPEGKYVPRKGRTYHDWYHVCGLLAKDYLPEHEAVLNALHGFAVSEGRATAD